MTKDELGQFQDQDSIIELSDKSGFYVTVSAFHGLHCVRRFHKYMYIDHYYPEISEWEMFMLRRHTGNIILHIYLFV